MMPNVQQVLHHIIVNDALIRAMPNVQQVLHHIIVNDHR